MNKLPIIIVIFATSILGFLYWFGGVEREAHEPYWFAQHLAPVSGVQVVSGWQGGQPDVFLSVRGEMSSVCGVLAEPEVLQVGGVHQIRLLISEPIPCDTPRPFEVRIALGLLEEPSIRQFVDINGYAMDFILDEEVVPEKFSYSERAYLEYPAELYSGQRGDLVVSISSLESQADWIQSAYASASVNFAGKYVVLQKDCEEDEIIGLPCRLYVVIDAVTGRTVQSLSYEGYPAGFTKNSYLFVVNDPLLTDIDTPEEVKFLLFAVDNALPRFDEIAVGVASEYDRSN